MANQNPFKILGINAETLVELTDAELSLLVKDCHRTFAKIFHPDLGAQPSRERFDAINWAREELDFETNRASFAHWRETYAPRKNKKAPDELALERKRLRLEQISSTNEMLWHSFLVAYIKPELEQFRITPVGTESDPDEPRYEFTGASVFLCRPLRITCWVKGGQVEVATDVGGNTVIYELTDRRLDIRKELVPTVPRYHVTVSDVSFNCRVLERGDTLLSEPNMRIVGTLVGRRTGRDQLSLALAEAGLHARRDSNRSGCIPLLDDDLSIIFPFFRPRISPREVSDDSRVPSSDVYSYLLAVCETEKQELQFYLLGIPRIIVPRGEG